MKRVIYYILLALLLSAPAQAQGWKGSVNGQETFSGTAARPQIANGPTLGTAAYPWLAVYTKNLFTSTTGCLGWGAAASQFCLDSANQVSLLNGVNAQRFNIANTYTSSISREDFSVDWQTTANTAIVGTRTAAAGSIRRLFLVSQNTNGAAAYSGISIIRGSAPDIRMGLYSADGVTPGTTGSLEMVRLAENIFNATSGTVTPVTIQPVYNEASGNAANTDLLINRTETLVGSGTQLFTDMQVGGSSKFAINHFGSISQLAGTATQGFGTPVIRAVGRSAAQTAAVASVAAIANVGSADGTFEVSANVLVTTATTHTFTVTCAYTDEGNTARTLTLQFSSLAGAFLTSITNVGGAVPYEGAVLHIRAKAGTAITIATTGTFTTVTYNVEGIIRQLS